MKRDEVRGGQGISITIPNADNPELEIVWSNDLNIFELWADDGAAYNGGDSLINICPNAAMDLVGFFLFHLENAPLSTIDPEYKKRLNDAFVKFTEVIKNAKP